ncbi:ankyrin repeat-containing domain protein [Spinellus fusiger]|nr:ankyrin repeat-containing domain protein [Spinellus fusiger]
MKSISKAAYEEKLFVLQQLLEKEPALATTQDEDGRTALHWAASGGQEQVARFLLEKGASVFAIDESGWTPLMIAGECVAVYMADSKAD